jgi:hypothetical protein
VAKINLVADRITKNTWKNLIVGRMIDKIQAKIKRCHNNYKIHVENNHCYSDKFFCNYIRYKIIRLVNAMPDYRYG